MPVSIRIRYDDHLVRDMIGRFATQIPKSGKRDVEEIANAMRRELRREITLKRLKWEGTLWRNIHVKRVDNNSMGIFIPLFGLHLDRMSPHWVSKKRRAHLGLGSSLTIEDWIRQKGTAGLKKAMRYRQKIYVRPHPWIDAGVRRASAVARKKARDAHNIRKTIKKKGK